MLRYVIVGDNCQLNIMHVLLIENDITRLGMFWRSDPTSSDLANQLRIDRINWPRDGAMIQGDVMLVGKNKWLRATKVKQKNEDWMAAPSGAFLPFEHDDHYFLEEDNN
jgi:hypothetical protein